MKELLHGVFTFALYITPLIIVMLLLRRYTRVGNELFRKMLHFLFLGAYIPLLRAFDHWWMLSGFALLIIVVFYPVLMLFERVPMFTAFVNERKHGEFKNSLILALGVMAVCVAVCWGLMGDKLLVLACIYAWGVGDGFAALIGKTFGRHKWNFSLADKHKSVEGTMAMFLAAFASVLTILILRGAPGTVPCILIALVTAAATAFVELCAKGGWDTLLCPLTAMVIILPLVHLFGG